MIFLLALFLLFIFLSFIIAKKTGVFIVIPNFSGGVKEVLPQVPDLQIKYSIFDTIMKMFGSDANTIEGLPVEAGTIGNKANPFEQIVIEPTPTTPLNPDGSPPPADIGQGTK